MLISCSTSIAIEYFLAHVLAIWLLFQFHSRNDLEIPLVAPYEIRQDAYVKILPEAILGILFRNI